MKKFYVKIKKTKYDSLSEETCIDFIKEAVIEFQDHDVDSLQSIRSKINEHFGLSKYEENLSIEIFTKL
jgi:hypothetical protein